MMPGPACRAYGAVGVIMATDRTKSSGRQRLAQILRTIILVTGTYQLVFGERLMGLATLLCLLAITLPGLVTRGRLKALPLQFELILFGMVTLQFVVGEFFNFYDNVPYFDKVVHFSLPFFLGYIVAMLAYAMVTTGNLRMSAGLGFVIVVLVTMGIGAFWEIVEYLSDIFLHTVSQGSLTANPLVDTMNDLIADTLGGLFGALVAWRAIRRGRATHDERLSATTDEIATDFSMASRK